MTLSQAEVALLRRYGVRAEPAMLAYVVDRLATGTGGFAILAGDARTGQPVRQVVAPVEMASTIDGAEVGR